MTTCDLFAGSGGWDEALAALGVADVLGIELDEAACATAEAAGHKRIQADVAAVDLRDFGPVTGLVGSPPCPSFSPAGKGLGKLDAPKIIGRIAAMRAAGRWLGYDGPWADPRSPLVLEPLRYALELRPDWIALEQVPPVLPIWQAMAEVLRDHGYHVDAGWLTAEQYGVPQTRKRAILTAQRCPMDLGPYCTLGAPLLPAPTHRKYRKGVAQHEGDPALLPWVSMADALGTLTGSEVMRSNYGTNGDPAARGERAAGQPAAAGSSTDRTVRFGNQEHSATACDWIDLDKPATTVQGDPRIAPRGHHDRQMNGAVRVSVQEAAVLQSFRPDYPWQGSRTAQYQQVGNAIPPLLAQAVLRSLIG